MTDEIPEGLKLCQCGELVDDHVRFHHMDDGSEGHYVDEVPKGRRTELLKPDPIDTMPELPKRQHKRPYDLDLLGGLWCLDGSKIDLAPPPGSAPELVSTWPGEDELRRGALGTMESLGWTTHDLEQGYRGDNTTRVSVGIGDAYVQGFGIRAWIEFKRWDNRPSADQIAFGINETQHGGHWLLIYETEQLVRWHELVRRAR